MLTLARPATLASTILEHLDAGGATDLRAATDHVWILGRAPSGAQFELLERSRQGYAVTRRGADDQPQQSLGRFLGWEAAVDRALLA